MYSTINKQRTICNKFFLPKNLAPKLTRFKISWLPLEPPWRHPSHAVTESSPSMRTEFWSRRARPHFCLLSWLLSFFLQYTRTINASLSSVTRRVLAAIKHSTGCRQCARTDQQSSGRAATLATAARLLTISDDLSCLVQAAVSRVASSRTNDWTCSARLRSRASEWDNCQRRLRRPCLLPLHSLHSETRQLCSRAHVQFWCDVMRQHASRSTPVKTSTYYANYYAAVHSLTCLYIHLYSPKW